MDGQRFDAMTRLLARGLPRRSALKALLGAGAAAVVTRAVTQEAKACEHLGNTCGPDYPCCEPYVCIFHECAECMDEGTPGCGGHEDCCHGLKCKDGTCEKDKKSDCEGKHCKHKKHRKHNHH